MKTNKTGIIILAAGASTRMGAPKQLVNWQGKTLLNHCLNQAENSSVDEIFVILGANYQQIYPTIVCSKAQIFVNNNWPQGMASSIRLGVGEAQKSNLDAVIVMLADQPFVHTNFLNQMIDKYNTNHSIIIATLYNTSVGVPALYDRSVFFELLKLKGDKGAKPFLMQNKSMVETINADFELKDIDFQEDINIYKSNKTIANLNKIVK